MNKLLIAIMLVGVLSLQAQVKVKDFTLGKTSPKSVEATTIGGTAVSIIPFKLNDGRIYDIAIIPSDDGINSVRVYNTDVDRLKHGFENHYGVKFTKHVKNSSEYILKGSVSGCVIYFLIDKNEYMDPPIKLSIFVTDPVLNKINEKEELEKASSDF